MELINTMFNQKLTAAILTLLFCSTTIAAEPKYPVDPDSVKKPGIPVGKVTQGTFSNSKIYPGTTRDYFVYVPAQYDASKPAALMVFQDGKSYLRNVPAVFDNLIHKKEMPITIGVFINPGVVEAPSDKALARYNRSFEYDAVDDRYSKFLLEEILPVALKDLNVTNDPNLRAICGSSSGGIAAFVAAWQRPDSFRRVFTTVGTYVGLRGGNELPVLVRKTEPKPLRIFLQDGRNDLNIYCGSWWVANQDMLSSLQWAGYEVNFEWGEGGHNRKHGNAIFSDVMRWLWKDWATAPKISTHLDKSKSEAHKFLDTTEDWQLVSEGHGFTEGPAIHPKTGELYFSDIPQSKVWRVNNSGKVELFAENTGNVNGLAFSPDGKSLYGCQGKPGAIIKWDMDSKSITTITKNVKPNDVTVAHDGTVYFTEPRSKKVWVIPAGSEKAKVAAADYSGVNGVILSADQSLVFAADFSGRFVWSAQRKKDQTLAYNQPYYHLHVPGGLVDIRSKADGMCMTQDGWLLVATAMGIQICDMPGRVHLIVPTPLGSRYPSNCVLKGNTLYVTCGDKVFKRKVKMKAAQSYDAPVKPAKPRL